MNDSFKSKEQPLDEIEVLRRRIAELERELENTRKEAQSAEAALEGFKPIVDKSRQLMGLLKVDGIVVYANDTALESTGIELKDVEGKLFWDTKWWSHSEEEREKLKNAVQRAAKGETSRFETTHLNRDGGHSIIDFQIGPLFDREERIIYLVPESRDITELKLAEKEREEYISFLEKLDKIDQVVARSTNLDRMLDEILEEALEIFEADRAWLLYPCDQDESIKRIVKESTRPEHPGLLSQNGNVPPNEELDRIVMDALGSSAPVVHDPETDYPFSEELKSSLRLKSFILTALYPVTGKPWMLGLHQCSHDRVWSNDDRWLFREMSRRITDGLGSALLYKQLEESEQKYRTLVDNIPGAVYRCKNDEYWTMEYLSDAIEKISGFPASDFIDNRVRSYASFIHPDDSERVGRKVGALFNSDRSAYLEYRIINSAGEVRWVYEACRGIRNEEGRVSHIEGAIFDATEEKRAEDALKKSEELFRTIAENSPVMITGIDPVGKLIFWNKASERELGWSFEEVREIDDILALCYPEDDIYKQVVENVEAADGIFREFTPRAKDGSHRVQLWADFRLPDGSVISVGHDITDRKRAEEALRNKEKEMRRLIEASPQPMMMHNKEGEIILINQKFTELFGYGLEDIPTLDHYWKLAYPDEKYRMQRIERWHSRVEKAECGEQDIDKEEGVITCKDGSRRIVVDLVSVIDDKILVSDQDVTELKQLEEEKMVQNRLQAAIETAGAVCHEMNQPLQIAEYKLEVLLMKYADDPLLQKDLQMVLDAMERMAGITRRLQNITKYRTREYMDDIKILDIDESTQ